MRYEAGSNYSKVREKAPKVRENTDGGGNPQQEWQHKTKPRRGERTFCHPFRVFITRHLFTGVNTPACGLSHLRCLFTGCQYNQNCQEIS